MPQRFERSVEIGFRAVRDVVCDRGGQYGDTLQQSQWLTLKSAVLELTGQNIDNDQACIIGLAALNDVKYWRQLGRFKLDSLIDQTAYSAALLGEILNHESTHSTNPVAAGPVGQNAED